MPILSGTVTANEFGGTFESGSFQGSLTALFGRTDRVHTVPHSGTDIAARAGTLCPALCAGKVAFISIDGDAGWAEIFGNSVIIETDDACILYGHLRDVPTLVMGQPVQTGDTIGRVGSTGRSTGPHLHLGAAPLSNPWLRKDADGGVTHLLDPMQLLAPRRRTRVPPTTAVRVELADHLVEQALALRNMVQQGAPVFAVNTTLDQVSTLVDSLRTQGARRG